MKKLFSIARVSFFVVSGFFIFPHLVLADVGTPLMWAGMLHLLIGNAVIGVVEGIVIARIFKVKTISSILIMVLANYVSMIAGSAMVLLISNAFERFVTIYSAMLYIYLFLFISFVLSVLLEWPFCYWILKKLQHVKKKAWQASVIAQFISYAVIVPLYFYSSGLTLITDCRIEKSLSFVKSNPWVYYLSIDNHDLKRIRLDGSVVQKVKEIEGISNVSARLFVKSSEAGDRWDLWAVDRQADGELTEMLLIRGIGGKDIAGEVEPFRGWNGSLAEKERDTWSNMGIADFRALEDRDWKVNVGVWAAQGLHARSEKEAKDFYVAMETPFVQWIIRNVTILPQDQFVFSLGTNQIVVMDLKTRKIGLLAFGHGPVVVFDKKEGRK